jgi:hypothetical protein
MLSTLAKYAQDRRRGRRLTGDVYAHYDFEPTSYDKDSSGNGHNLTVTGAPGINASGKNDRGLLLSDVTKYVGFQDINSMRR